LLNKDLISASVPIQLMTDYHLSHLPVIAEDKFVGLANEDELLNVDDDRQLLEKCVVHLSTISVNANMHFMEAVKIANENSLSVVPVVDANGWVGAITSADLLKWMGKINGSDEPGGIIVLELEKKEFSFSEIAKIVETNDSYITHLNTFTDNHLGVLYVTLKINKLEISDIVATFQRYEYQVKYYFGEELYENEIRTNYDHLMNYLNI
jgi:acetoin utilization protein AcuB